MESVASGREGVVECNTPDLFSMRGMGGALLSLGGKGVAADLLGVNMRDVFLRFARGASEPEDDPDSERGLRRNVGGLLLLVTLDIKVVSGLLLRSGVSGRRTEKDVP